MVGWLLKIREENGIKATSNNTLNMDNPTFEIYYNNKLITVAGLSSQFGVVTAITTWVRSSQLNHERLTFTVGGLDAIEDQHVSWFDKDVSIGDEIMTRITGHSPIVAPEKKPKPTSEDILADKLRYFYRLKEELKDHLNES